MTTFVTEKPVGFKADMRNSYNVVDTNEMMKNLLLDIIGCMDLRNNFCGISRH